MSEPSDVVAEILTAAADDIENRTYVTFTGGPNVWRAVHGAAHDLVTHPAVEALRLHLGIDQVQHWRAEQATVVKTLREVAGVCEQLDLLRGHSADNRIAEACRVLHEALGLSGDVDHSLHQLADYAAGRIRQLQDEVDRLRAESERAWTREGTS